MKNNASLTYNAILVLGDIAAVLAGFAAAFVIRASSDTAVAHPMSGLDYMVILLALIPFWILVFAFLGLYNTTIYERRFAEANRLFIGTFIGLMFIITWDYMSLEYVFPAKLVPVYGLFITFVLLLFIRNIIRFVRTSLFKYDIGLTRVVIVGNTEMTAELLRTLRPPESGYKVLGVIGYRRKILEGVEGFPNFSAFLSGAPRDLHGIIQTELYPNEERNAEILTYAQENHVSYRFVPGNSELFVGNIDVDLFRNSIPVIQVRQTALFGWGRIIKRLFDLLIAVLVLVVTSPIFLIIYIVEKFSGGGSVYFTHTRLTRFGTPFKLYKFRSQYQKYDGTTPEQAFAMMGKPELAKEYRANGDSLPNDPRITRLGRFIRATSIDELPQLINVLKGDLSLVGPRALIPEEIHAYGKKHIILSVKSGLTGLAIVSGRRNIPYEERRKLDVYYVQNWTFGLDIVILLKTVRMLVGRIGAR
ncbi:MAG: exopolysaccharide biosynthesis polyprenyl glycosylphosphotransferase [Candidatus Saccharimonadales bacterium]